MSDVRYQLRIGGTVRGRAAEELRNRILTGVLAPGTRIDLDVLSAEFGISRTPLREALLELSYEGLVEVAPRSGITVIGLDPRDVLDNFDLLGTLAGKAAEWAAARMTREALAALEQLNEAVHHAPHPEALVAANWRFHRAVHRASESRRLITLIRQTVGVVPTNFFEVFPGHAQHTTADHDELIGALRRRNGAAARKVAERHVVDAGAALASFLEQASSPSRQRSSS
ncbi:MAG TPA: GntR family transcriptional regulator [Acidimicrobiia bacterium]|nr:GntR family transcriptional regulator [Acidimicrobiia bacterium]